MSDCISPDILMDAKQDRIHKENEGKTGRLIRREKYDSLQSRLTELERVAEVFSVQLSSGVELGAFDDWDVSDRFAIEQALESFRKWKDEEAYSN